MSTFLIENWPWLLPLAALWILSGVCGIIVGNRQRRADYQDYLVEQTRGYIAENHKRFLVTYVSAPQGSGKTTFAAALTGALKDYLVELQEKKLSKAPVYFYDVDFCKIDAELNESYAANTSEEAATMALIRKNQPFSLKFDEPMRRELVSGSSIIREYVDAYYAKKRNNYVMCAGRGYTGADGVQSYNFKPDMLDIKLHLEAHDYAIPRYCIVLDDEKQNDSEKSCYNNFSYAREDTGSPDWMRLIRHIGQETNFYISTDQNFNSSISVERKLATAIVYILGYTVHQVNYGQCDLYKRLERLIKSHYERLCAKKGKNYAESCKLKRLLFSINRRKKAILAQAKITYDTILYYSASDVGKKVDSTTFGAERRSFTFDITDAFGAINTHSMQQIYDLLRDKAVDTSILLDDDPQKELQDVLSRPAERKKQAKEQLKNDEILNRKRQKMLEKLAIEAEKKADREKDE